MGLIRTGIRAFRSGGFRRAAKFARGIGKRGFKRGLKRFRDFRRRKRDKLNPKNLFRFRRFAGSARNAGRRALQFGRRGVRSVRSRAGIQRRQAGLRGF